MEDATNLFLCHRIGIRPGQKRNHALYPDVWWSFDYGNKVFGFGDLDQEDLEKIQAYLTDAHENGDGAKVFTAWHKDHGTDRPHPSKALVRISWVAGVTRPYDAHLEARLR